MKIWTIQKLLNWITEYFTEKAIDAPRLSAELLLSHVLAMTRIELYTKFDKPVDQRQLDQLHALTKRAGQDEPLAYLIVERAIEFLRARIAIKAATPDVLYRGQIAGVDTTPAQSVCDLCTGSGCIAVAIAKNFPSAKLIATDICDRALEVAASNTAKHGLTERIALLHGDLFDPLIRQLDNTEFDLIVCNPPYISAPEFDALDKNVRDYEPRIALLAGSDGLDVYRRIIEKADTFLKPDAALMLEIGYAQGPAVKKLIEQTDAFAQIKIEKDPHNNDRIVTARKNQS